MKGLTKGNRALLWCITLMLTCWTGQAGAQSATQEQKSGDARLDAQQYMEILGTAIRTLQTHYVDSVNWSRVLTAGIEAMLQELDPYTEFYSEADQQEFKTMTTGEYAGIGAIIMQLNDTVCISEPYEKMPAAQVNLLPGDRILSVDGENMIGKGTAYVSEHLRGQPNTTFALQILRPGEKEPRVVEITRQKIVIDAVPYYGWMNDSIGYIQLNNFTDKAALDVQNSLIELQKGNLKGLVFDLRSNPGGLVDEAVKLVSMFVPKGSIVVETKAKTPDRNTTYRTNTPPIEPDLKLAVLIDRSSASASEILSGALQDYDRAVIMGERSYGKGLVQSSYPLPYNTILKYTSAKYYIPSGRCIQAIDYQARRVARWEAGQETPDLGRIPDSLTHVFHTAAGREVRDGGGIKPDVERKPQTISNLTYYLQRENRFFHFANRLRFENETIPAVTDSVYADFCREVTDTRRDTVLRVMKINLQHDLDSLKSEVIEQIEMDLELRYNFRRGMTRRSLEGDDLVREAVALLADDKRYTEILSAPKADKQGRKGTRNSKNKNKNK
ncbi:MAG: S41 family peptidase [Bacteroidales bacterium]|nr:S41 family peptidase [Bacteroidales bacterium]MBO7379901.1 S41 family peptidase [Bacteroidales bacterium]MBP5214919.1 S41 family peptidase [Bacteroidales bacterium]MBP5765283.1 S41 family peptidase [Bacteroidales bacterium]